jgi:hypothetical protein
MEQFTSRLVGKPNTSALEALQARPENLAWSSNDVGALAGKLKGIDDCVGKLDRSLGWLRDELAALRAKVEEVKPTTTAEGPKPAPAAPDSEERNDSAPAARASEEEDSAL